MKTIEELEKEYESFQPTSTQVTSLPEFVSFIEVGIDDTYDIEKDLQREMRENRRNSLETKIRNFFLCLIGEEEIDFFEEDNQLLLEQLSLALEYRELFMRIFIDSSDENIEEFIKLVDFASEYYGKHVDYLEYKRDQLEMSVRGYSMINSKYEDNREVIRKFLDQKLTIFEEQDKEKQKQYKKVQK